MSKSAHIQSEVEKGSLHSSHCDAGEHLWNKTMAASSKAVGRVCVEVCLWGF